MNEVELIDLIYRAALIDGMEICIFLLDARGRLNFSNKAASRLMSGRALFHVDSRGALRLNDTKADEALRAGMNEIARRDLTLLRGDFALRDAASAQPLVARLAPFAVDHDATGIFTDFIADRLPVAVLTIDERPAQPKSSQQMLAATYGVTPAELELALALQNGTTLRDYAALRSVSLFTVRNQLKSLFDKMSVHRQAELVSLLGRLTSH